MNNNNNNNNNIKSKFVPYLSIPHHKYVRKSEDKSWRTSLDLNEYLASRSGRVIPNKIRYIHGLK